MATVYIVEVLAIYESPGTTPSAARINQRDSDMTAAAQRSDAYAPGGVPPADEYLEATSPKYGFGWHARQFITVRQSASTLGATIWTALSSRSLKAGTKVEVFPDDRESGGGTGDALFRRRIPTGTDDVG